jgi:hypothetical protein
LARRAPCAASGPGGVTDQADWLAVVVAGVAQVVAVERVSACGHCCWLSVNSYC